MKAGKITEYCQEEYLRAETQTNGNVQRSHRLGFRSLWDGHAQVDGNDDIIYIANDIIGAYNRRDEIDWRTGRHTRKR